MTEAPHCSRTSRALIVVLLAVCAAAFHPSHTAAQGKPVGTYSMRGAMTPLPCPLKDLGPAAGTVTPSAPLTLRTPGGQALSIPAGAVVGPKSFWLMEPPSEVVEVFATDYKFQVPATLTMTYRRCGAGVDTVGLGIYQMTPAGAVRVSSSKHDPRTKTVTANVDEMSGYLLATPD